jgi:pimeloyl-ACP methyl ester carboxylesterase
MKVLVVHGALGSASQLEPLRRALGASHDAECVELEGHGSTPPAGDRFSMTRFVENIQSKLTDRAFVFAYSMGGYAALLLAAREPERVAGVITLGTKLAWSPEVAAKEVGRLDPGTIRARVPKFAGQLEERHRGAGGWETVLAKTAALMTDLGSHPLVDDLVLASIGVPVRLMVGDRDTLVTMEETAAAARKIPKGELAVLPATPHPIEQVRPGLILDQLADFAR